MAALRPEVLAEIGCGAADRLAFEREALSVFDAEMGFDVAWFGYADGPSSVAPGLLDSVRAGCAERWHVYRADTDLLEAAARRDGGVAVDRDVLGVVELKRRAVYQEMMRPHGGTCTALLFLQAHGQPLSRMVLGRAGGAGFSQAELACLRACVPVLSLSLSSLGVAACASVRGRTWKPRVALPPLTAREQEILGFLPLGYTNAQIALALGTAPRTVRNQLSRAFDKLGVASRAEAAALVVAATQHGPR